MKKKVYYNPLKTKYKSVLGGIAANEGIKVSIQVDKDLEPSRVYFILVKDGETEVQYQMAGGEKNSEGKLSFSLPLSVTTAGLYFYHFEIHNKDGVSIVGANNNLSAELHSDRWWQLTIYEKHYASPSWLSGGVMYQILPDRFFDAGEKRRTKSGVVYRNDWRGCPEYKQTEEGKILNNDFFGGNILGIIKKLGYLKSLGVTCIYLNPIFEAYSNHKYDTGNYLKIDSDFGTEEDLAALIKRAKKRGMKVILDGVFSHTGDNSIYFNKYKRYDSIGAYQGEDSPYYDWFDFSSFPDSYKSWWGIDTIPQTNKSCKYFTEFICGVEGVLAKWQQKGIGGWRLDVADELPNHFLDKITNRVKKITPDALVLGEVWEDASHKISYSERKQYLQGKQLDSVSNYPFKEDIIHFVKWGDSERLSVTIRHLLNNYPKHSLDNLMNILGTHDTTRILTELGTPNGKTDSRDARAKTRVANLEEALEKVKLAAALQYTLPGVPCVYYGDEVGVEGYEDPFNRRCYPWETETEKRERPYKKLLSFYRMLGRIRKENLDIFAAGDFKLIEADKSTFIFCRESESEKITIVANASENPLEYAIAGGVTNLLTKKPYSGVVPAFGTAIVKKV